MPSPEVLAVLADEVADAAESLAKALTDYGAASGPDQAAEAIERYREPVQRIADTSELLNLEGLQQLCAHIETNIAALDGRTPGSALRELLEKWPALVIGYLRAPQDGVYSHELVDHFRNTGWPAPLGAVEAINLTRKLSTIADSTDDASDTPARAMEARPEDVTLAIPADVNPALVESFLTEGPLQAGAYTSLVEHVIRGGAGPESLNEARRLVHSIKGAANTIGVRGVAQLTHHLEDLLEYLVQRSITPQGALAKLLMDAADCLEMMLESLLDNEPAPSQSQSVLQRLLDAANAIDRGEAIDVADAGTKKHPTPAADDTAHKPVTSAVASPAAAAPASDTRSSPPTDVKRAIRVAAATIEEVLRLSSEMTISRSHIQELLHQAFSVTAELREHHGLLQNRATELDNMVTVQGVAAGQKRGDVGGTGIFDALEMDQYSELHGTVHGFVETAADIQALGTRLLDALAAVETAVTQQGFVNAELHEQVMRARMVAASAIEPRLARTVRQVCDATGKRARLEFLGGDVMLDDHVVNDLINPLVHLLRNAVDHGLEPPDQRAAAGKPEDGTVRLAFVREGNHIVIRCEDDGAGLDLSRIHGIAVQRGLVSENTELSDTEIARLILLPGFSTSGNVSEISGRGVGMDIVHTGVRKLKGTIDIQTANGKGCRFTLRLPLTLGSAHCLLVRSAGTLAAIPTDTLDRVVYTGAHNIERLGAHWTYREEHESIDVHDLADLLGYPAERMLGQADDARPVIVVNDAEGKQAVVVDALLSGRDLVIKHLGHYLMGAKGIVGASQLGDGQVLPVLDMHELLHLRRGETVIAPPQLVRTHSATRPTLTDILVVDDSLSVRQALTQLLEDDGYKVHTAKDGVEALEYLSKERPAALLVDLEMPRMNGLELTQRLRERDDTRNLPVIMVTSRTSEKHRMQAQLSGVDLYLTKPYREGDLLTRLRSMLSQAA
jgi:chemotaxis protein histidine kinase CheA/ActR/RegA family two-component response regulator/plasmid stabilization system protein ParE